MSDGGKGAGGCAERSISGSACDAGGIHAFEAAIRFLGKNMDVKFDWDAEPAFQNPTPEGVNCGRLGGAGIGSGAPGRILAMFSGDLVHPTQK